MQFPDLYSFQYHFKKQVTHFRFVFWKDQSIMTWFITYVSHPMTDENLKLFIPSSVEDTIMCHVEMVLIKLLN